MGAYTETLDVIGRLYGLLYEWATQLPDFAFGTKKPTALGHAIGKECVS